MPIGSIVCEGSDAGIAAPSPADLSPVCDSVSLVGGQTGMSVSLVGGQAGMSVSLVGGQTGMSVSLVGGQTGMSVSLVIGQTGMSVSRFSRLQQFGYRAEVGVVEALVGAHCHAVGESGGEVAQAAMASGRGGLLFDQFLHLQREDA